MGTKILSCTCSSGFQDNRYGTGNRVHNETVKKPDGTNFKCVVCGSRKKSGVAEKEENKK